MIALTILFDTKTSFAIAPFGVLLVFLVDNNFGVESISLSEHELQHIGEALVFILSSVFAVLTGTSTSAGLSVLETIAIVFQALTLFAVAFHCLVLKFQLLA